MATYHEKILPGDERSLHIDPSGGWRYGFPKILPRDLKEGDLEIWLRSYNYPERDIELAMKYSRYWKR